MSSVQGKQASNFTNRKPLVPRICLGAKKSTLLRSLSSFTNLQPNAWWHLALAWSLAYSLQPAAVVEAADVEVNVEEHEEESGLISP